MVTHQKRILKTLGKYSLKLFNFKIWILLLAIILFFNTFEISAAEIKFEDVSNISGISYAGKSWGSAWGDFNGDGWPDLWLGNHGKTPNLYVNNGDGTFSDLASGVLQDDSKGRDTHGASWADFDNDGDQDLILLTGAERGMGDGANLFFINEDGKFQKY